MGVCGAKRIRFDFVPSGPPMSAKAHLKVMGDNLSIRIWFVKESYLWEVRFIWLEWHLEALTWSFLAFQMAFRHYWYMERTYFYLCIQGLPIKWCEFQASITWKRVAVCIGPLVTSKLIKLRVNNAFSKLHVNSVSMDSQHLKRWNGHDVQRGTWIDHATSHFHIANVSCHIQWPDLVTRHNLPSFLKNAMEMSSNRCLPCGFL